MIPVEFDYEGTLYSGYLSKVSGGGTNSLYHLMINNYYRGQLFYTERNGWQFGSNDGMFEDIAWWFGEQVEKNM